MREALSALCQGRDRPEARRAVTDNGGYVRYALARSACRTALLAALCWVGMGWLGGPETALADPMYRCGGVETVADAVAGPVMINAFGEVMCRVFHDATLSLDGELNAAPSLGSASITDVVYDSAGRFVTDVGPFVTTTSYDSAGVLLSATNPLGTTHFSYDSLDRLVSDTGPSGAITATVYDSTGRLASYIDGLGSTTVFQYEAPGRLATESGPTGTTSYFYDPQSRLVTESGPLGTTSYGYDPLGRLSSTSDSLGTTHYFYDPGTGLLDEVMSPQGSITTFTYENGLLASVNDPQGTTTLVYTNIIPEPSSLFLLGTGLAGLLGVGWIKRRVTGLVGGSRALRVSIEGRPFHGAVRAGHFHIASAGTVNTD